MFLVTGLFDDRTSGFIDLDPLRFQYIEGSQDSSFYEKGALFPWEDDEPNNGEENCVECVLQSFAECSFLTLLLFRFRTRRNHWNDVSCDFETFALCQRSCPIQVPSEVPTTRPTLSPNLNPVITEAPTSAPTSFSDLLEEKLLIQPELFLIIFGSLLLLIVLLLILHSRMMKTKRTTDTGIYLRNP